MASGGPTATAAEARRRAPSGPKPRVPGLYTLFFWRDPIGALTALSRDYGDVVHWKFAGTDTYLLKDPEHIKRVLVTDHRAFMKGRALQVARRVLGFVEDLARALNRTVSFTPDSTHDRPFLSFDPATSRWT